MDIWENEDFTRFNGCNPDITICLKFPAYYLHHPNKRLWLLHQHRVVYDLWQEKNGIPKSLKNHIHEKDTYHLSQINHRFTNSRNVSKRLLHYNNLTSTPLYHPPYLAKAFYSKPSLPYIFYPSRLERLKRQELLIEAMRLVRSPVKALIAGTGGQFEYYENLIAQYGLSEKVKLLGEVGSEELLSLYAHALGVFFGPMDEDYGYVTLEAMLAGKPVITCTDSGGPLEFVEHNETGLITEPDPARIADVIETLAANFKAAEEMGRAGLEKYQEMEITWDHVLETLLAP